MNKKYKALAYWSIFIWFIIFAMIAFLIVSTPPIPPINYLILFAGISMMAYCAYNEEKLFPSEKKEE